MESETKIIYHIDDEDTPYLVTVPVPSDKVTLGDFKAVLNKPGYKYFFKSMDDDFGVVKEEIGEDAARLPYFNGRVVGWLVTAENSETGSISHGGHSSYKGSVDSLPQHVQQQQHGGERSGLPQRIGGIGDSRPPSFHANLGGGGGRGGSRAVLDQTETETETESMVSSRRGGHHGFPQGRGGRGGMGGTLGRNEFGPRSKAQGQLAAISSRHHPHLYQDTTTTTSSSMMSSDLETTSYWDSDDDLTCSRFSETTGTTGRSRGSRFKKRRRKHRAPPQMNRASSFSSITDSTLSLNIITVTLNMDTVNFLGISIVGQSNKGRGDGGIYVGSIMKGGAVAQDGRIEPGDMILQVNQISLENMSNDEAVKVLREAVQKPGPIKLIVAKCWDPSPSNYFAVPRQEPIRPIDPSAWVAHTEAVRQQEQYEDYGSLGPVPPGMATESLPGSIVGGPPWRGGGVGVGGGFGGGGPGSAGGGMMPGSVGAPSIPRMGPPGGVLPTSSSGGGGLGAYPPRPGPLSPSLTDLTSTSSSINSMLETGERLYEDLNLTTNTDMTTVAKAMAARDSGLEIRDRMWLKITIPNAFIGSDVVDWLFNHVEGFQDRRDARKYAMQMLKQGFIRHTVNKSSFSEQCYYVMAPHVIEMCNNFASLQLDDFDSVSEAGADPFRTQMANLGSGGGGSVGGGGTMLTNSRRGYYQGPPYLTGGIEGGAYVPPPLGYTPQPYITTYGGGSVGVVVGGGDHRGVMDGGERSGSQDSLNSTSTASGGSKGRKGGGGGGDEKKDAGHWFRNNETLQLQQRQQQQQKPGSGQDSDSTSQAGSVISASDQSSLLQKQQLPSGRGGGGGGSSKGLGGGVGGKMGLFGGTSQHHQPYDGPASFLNGGGEQSASSPNHGPRPPLGGGVGGLGGIGIGEITNDAPLSTTSSAAGGTLASQSSANTPISTIQARLLQHHLHPVLPPLPPPKPSVGGGGQMTPTMSSANATSLASSSSAPPSYSDALFNSNLAAATSGLVATGDGSSSLLTNNSQFHLYHQANNVVLPNTGTNAVPANSSAPTSANSACSTFLQPSIKL